MAITSLSTQATYLGTKATEEVSQEHRRATWINAIEQPEAKRVLRKFCTSKFSRDLMESSRGITSSVL